MSAQKNRIRKNFVFPTDIVKWAESYAEGQNTTLTRLILDYLTQLRHQTETVHVEQI